MSVVRQLMYVRASGNWIYFMADGLFAVFFDTIQRFIKEKFK